jgi:hypothetical protein
VTAAHPPSRCRPASRRAIANHPPPTAGRPRYVRHLPRRTCRADRRDGCQPRGASEWSSKDPVPVDNAGE